MKLELSKEAVKKRHEAVIDLLKDKSLSMKEISEIVGLSPRGVSYINLKYGIRNTNYKTHIKFNTDFDSNIENELKNKDIKISDLVKKYGCSPSHIQNLIYRKKINRVKAKSDRQVILENKSKEALMLLNKNHSIESIANKLNVSRRFVSIIASKNNLTYNVNSYREYFLARIPIILDYTDTKLTIPQIARMFNVSESTVSRLRAKRKRGDIVYDGVTLTFMKNEFKYKTYIKINMHGSKLNYKLVPLGGSVEDAVIFKYK